MEGLARITNRLLVCSLLVTMIVIVTACNKKSTDVSKLDCNEHPIVKFSCSSFDEYGADFKLSQEELKDAFEEAYYSENNYFDGDAYFHWYESGNKVIFNEIKNANLTNSFECEFTYGTIEKVVRVNDSNLVLVTSDSLVSVVDDSIYQCVPFDIFPIEDIEVYDGKLTIASPNSIDVYDEFLSYENTISTDDSIVASSILEDSLYVAFLNGNEITISEYDLKNLKHVADVYKLTLPSMTNHHSIGSYVNLAFDFVMEEKDRFILATNDGIFEYSKGDVSLIANSRDFGVEFTIWDKIISVDDSKICVTSNVMVNAGGGFENQYVEYIKCDSSEKKEIVAGMFVDYSYFFQSYNRSSKDCYISLVFPDNAENDIEETISLITDGYNVDFWVLNKEYQQKMLQSGTLYDLNQMNINSSELYPNIYKLTEVNGERYCIPAELSLRYFAYSSNSPKGEPDLDSILNSKNTNCVFYRPLVGDVVYLMYGMFNSEIQSSGSISKATVEKYLDMCQMVNQGFTDSKDIGSEFASGDVIFDSQIIQSYIQFYGNTQAFGDSFMVCAPWGYATPVVDCNVYLAVNSTSENLAECEKILNYCLSKDVQKQVGIPINREAMLEIENEFFEDFDYFEFLSLLQVWTHSNEIQGNNIFLEEQEYYDYSLDELNSILIQNKSYVRLDLITRENTAKRFNEIMESVTSWYSIDYEITAIITEEMQGYVMGNKSKEQTIEVICSRVNTYVAENYG